MTIRNNPHHDNLLLALGDETPWGIAAKVKELSDTLNEKGWRLQQAMVSEPRLDARRRYRLVTAEIVTNDEQPQDVTNEFDERVGRITLAFLPDVAPNGTVYWDGRHYAPTAFLRLKPGVYEFSESADKGEHDETTSEVEAGGSGESGADVPPIRRVLVPDVGLPVRVHGEETVSVPTIGRVPLADVVAALGDTSADVGRRAGRIARYLFRLLGDDASTFLDSPSSASAGATGAPLHHESAGATEPLPPALHEPLTETEFLADLEKCRLVLAGHYLSAELGRGFRSAARKIIDNECTVTQAIELFPDEADDYLSRAITANRADPDGGMAPFDLLDDTNPLAVYEQCRKVSRLGPDGVGLNSSLAEPLRDIHPSHAGRLCPLLTPESDKIGLVRFLTVDAGVESDGTFSALEPEGKLTMRQIFSASALAMPLLNHDEGVRAVLGAKTIRQFVPLVAPQPPLVRTGLEKQLVELFAAPERATTNGTVSVTDHYLSVTPKGRTRGEPQKVRRRRSTQPPLAGTDDRLRPARSEWTGGSEPAGRHVAAGDPIGLCPGTTLDLSATSEVGTDVLFAPGANAVCALMPFRGLTVEDAVAVSESFAESMTSRHIEVVHERLAPGEALQFVSTMDPQGSEVKAYEELVSVVRYTDTGAEELRKVLSPHSGRILDVIGPDYEGGAADVRILIAVDRRLAVGDKVTARHGNKGVVSAVLPDDQMPLVKDYAKGVDRRADVVISPYGLVRRGVIGLLHELHWGRLADSGAIVPDQPPIGMLGVDELAEAMNQAGLDWDTDVQVPVGAETVTTPHVTVGSLYYLKLNHLAERKLQSQRTAPVSATTGQPARVRVDEHGQRLGRPQRLGEMELWALQAYNARETLEDLLRLQRGHRTGPNPSLWKTLDLLSAAGINSAVTFDGTEMSIDDIGGLSRQSTTPSSIRFELAEAVRLSDAVSLDDAPHPPIVLEPGEPVKEIIDERHTARRGGREAAHRALFDREFFSARDQYVVCDCGARDSVDATGSRWTGKTCATCNRVLRPVPALEWDHRVTHLRLPLTIVHPWFRPRFYGTLGAHSERARSVLGDELFEAAVPYVAFLQRVAAGEVDAIEVLEVDVGEPDASVEVQLIDRLLERLASSTDENDRDFARTLLGYTLTYLPVAPPSFRQEILRANGRSMTPRLQEAYNEIASSIRGAKRAPATLQGAERGKTYARVSQRVRRALGQATGASAGEGSIADLLRFKEGLLRRYLLGTSVWDSGRGVIVPDPELEVDQVRLPVPMMRWLNLEDDQRVIVNRAPTLLRTELLGLRAVGRNDEAHAIGVPPAILPMLAGDFDGDEVMVYAPGSTLSRNKKAAESASVRDEVAEKLTPLANLLSPQNGEMLIFRGEELAAPSASGASAELTRCARDLSQAFRDGSSIDDKRSDLRAAYLEGYRTGLGSGSVSIGALRAFDYRTGSSGALRDVVRVAYGDKDEKLAPIVDSIGVVTTFGPTSRRRGSVNIEGNLLHGLGVDEVISDARAAMVKLADKKLVTPRAGDLTKRLVEALYEVTITDDDCGAADTYEPALFSPPARRGATGARQMKSPLGCHLIETRKWAICAACYGNDLTTGQPVALGTRVGLLAAQAIGEQGTQLALKAIHAGTSMPNLDLVEHVLNGRRIEPSRLDAGRFTTPGVNPNGRSAMSLLREEPFAILHTLRWLYTLDGEPGDPDSSPSVADIHLEVLVASLRTASLRTGTDRGALLAPTVREMDPLAAASFRGSLEPLLTGADTGEGFDLAAWKTRLIAGG